MVHKMTIENMTMMSYIFLAIAVVLGMIAVILFFTWKIPKGYRAVKGHKKSINGKKITKRMPSKKGKSETVKLKVNSQYDGATEVFPGDEVQFVTLQDITFVHADEEQ